MADSPLMQDRRVLIVDAELLRLALWFFWNVCLIVWNACLDPCWPTAAHGLARAT